MEESIDDDYSVMGKSGSFACLSKKTITNCLECLISCLILVSAIYIALLISGFILTVKEEKAFRLLGYISLLVCLSAPVGLYGSRKSSYTCLILFFLLASYHLYGLAIYIWFSIRNSYLFSASHPADQNEASSETKSEGIINLHEITVMAYALTLLLTIFMTIFKLISTTRRLESVKVIVVDNNPVD